MAWFYLILGGFFEMGWTVGLKLSQSMQPRWLYIAMAVLSMSLSLFLLYLAQRTIAIGTSYVVWTGIGAVSTLLIGILFFRGLGRSVASFLGRVDYRRRSRAEVDGLREFTVFSPIPA